MFRLLMKKQFIEDILTFRFLISVVLILAAIAVLSLIFVGHYNSLLAAYTKASAQNDHSLQEFAKSPSENLSAVNLTLILKPRPELFLAKAVKKISPRAFITGRGNTRFRSRARRKKPSGRKFMGPSARKKGSRTFFRIHPI